MTDLVFVDTNVFIYAKDDADGIKRGLARDWLELLWRDQRGRTSVQVLNEYYATLTLKSKFKVSREAAWEDVRELLEWKPQELDIDVLAQAYTLEGRFLLNWWDCLIVAAAQVQGCSMLLTEDLQDGQRFDGIVARNPFKLGVAEAHTAFEPGPSLGSRHRGRGRPRQRSRQASTG
jgi:predicted nucleic acid-binding protein